MNQDKETHIVRTVMGNWSTGESNSDFDMEEYESAISLFNNESGDRDYDWQSDISIPEFSTQQLSQTALDVSQYFQTRDFVETYVQDPSDEALYAADAAEECINRTLNIRQLYHFQKFVRAKTLANITGEVIAQCWWEVDGDREQFNYDVVPSYNVKMSSEYTYSLQQKKWIVIRDEKDLEQIKADQESCEYFNLDKLEEIVSNPETAAARDRAKLSGRSFIPDNSKLAPSTFEIYKRYGKYWITPDGEIGINDMGEVADGAEWKEVVMEVAVSGTTEILIAFHLQKYMDADDVPFRPVIRGKCYIHPTEDHGLGDARFSVPLARGINDTFNVSNDRVMLATLPVMKVRANSYEHEDDLFIAPGNKIEVTNTDDIDELRINDNVQGAMMQMGVLLDKMQQANSIYPTTMGAGPERISETATAVATGEKHTNQRMNYKTTTFEYTFLNELYWMILNMTWSLASPQTGYELMGDKVFDFNPKLDFFYKPLSQSVEPEYSKNNKIRQLTTLFGYVAGLQQPNPELMNYMLAKIFMFMGDEYVNIADKMLNQQNVQEQQGPEQQGMLPQPGETAVEPTSNQYGFGQEEGEIETREMMGE